MKKLLFLLPLLCAACLSKETTLEPQVNKIAVKCKDSTRIVWNQQLLIETSQKTAEPCWQNGGIAYYIYK
jgi:hypothetical protein